MRNNKPQPGRGLRIWVVVGVLSLVLWACGGSGTGENTETTSADTTASDETDAEPTSAPVDDTNGETTEAAAESAEIEFVDGVLQPLPDGFPDQPITLIVVDDPGTRDGLYAIDMQNALESISPVEIVVSYEPHPQGGTLPTLAELKERSGGLDGYFPEVTTLVGTPTDLHIEPIEDEWGIGIDDVRFVVATESQPYVMVQRADAEWGDTFDDWVQYALDNPGELRYISAGVGSGHDISMEWLMSGLGIEVNKIPAAGHQEALAAIGAGEGDFTMTRAELASQNEEAGRVETIFVTTEGVPDPWTGQETIGSAADYDEYGLDRVAWGIVLGYMVPAEVPEAHAQWLFELFKAGAETEQWQNRLETVAGLEIYEEPLTPDEADALAKDVYEFSEPIVREIGLHHEDN